MYRLLAAAMLIGSLLSTGCCHCYNRTYYPGRGPVAAAIARPIRAAAGCSKGCGDVYWGEWISDPPDDCDPCCNGQFVGPRDCCGGRPHARLCIWRILEAAQGIRGSCVSGGCCDGGCGAGGCCDGGCSSCGCSDGGDEYGIQYADQGSVEYAPAASSPDAMQYETIPTTPNTYSDPAWNRSVPRAAPGVPTPTGRKPTRLRSAQSRHYGPSVRSVGYEEEVAPRAKAAESAEETAAAADESRQPPALMSEVLPDPRANYRR